MIGNGDVKSRASLLQTAASILQESFEPICDLSTGEDLVPKMVHSEGSRDHDFQGMYTVMLYFKGKPVSVATLRVFGPFLAEMPLVATRECARRQGHCRALLTAIETCLQELQVRRGCMRFEACRLELSSSGLRLRLCDQTNCVVQVEQLSLPAAAESEATWTHGFQFVPMIQEHLQVARTELRILTFPHARILHKQIVHRHPSFLSGSAIARGVVQKSAEISQE